MLVAALAMMLGSCSGDKPFKIKGEIADGTNTNLYVRYYGQHALNTLITAAREGKFEAQGSVDRPTVARILDKDQSLLALVFLRNGDEINVSIDRAGFASSKVTGNEVNDSLSAFLNANAPVFNGADAGKANSLIAGYVKKNPGSIVSAVLLGFVYDAALNPKEASELVGLLTEEAQLPYVVGQLATQTARFGAAAVDARVRDFKYLKAGTDSAQTFSAADRDVSLIVFSDDRSQRFDSIVPQLKDIYRASGASKLQIMDVIIANDTTSMKGLTRRDSVKWEQGWIPGGLLSDQLSPLGIPALPYYIVTDASGRQLYRGTSLSDARSAADKLLR